MDRCVKKSLCYRLNMILTLCFTLCQSYREEFFRLKKVKAAKKRHQDAAEKEREGAAKQDGQALGSVGNGADGGTDILDDGKDEDVIF